MNLANLATLRDTLLNLPPEIHFDIKKGRVTHPCGTAACIAGLAHILADPTATAAQDYGWYGVQRQAMRWLGLTMANLRATSFDHELFDYELAPPQCTPQQAAQAVQNVMENHSPWN